MVSARAVLFGTAVVSLALALTTAHRVPAWTSEMALWEAAVATAPQKPRPLVNLGNHYSLEGRFSRAEALYREAIRVASQPERGLDERSTGRALAEANLARVLFEQRKAWPEVRTLIDSAFGRAGYLEQVVGLRKWMYATYQDSPY